MWSSFPNGELTVKRINVFGFFLLQMWSTSIRFLNIFSTSSIKMYTGLLYKYDFGLCFLHAHLYCWYKFNLHLFYSTFLSGGLIAIAWFAGVSQKRKEVSFVSLTSCNKCLCYSQGSDVGSSPELKTSPKV